MTLREELEKKLAEMGYRFATEREWDSYYGDYIIKERSEERRKERIKKIVEAKKNCSLGMDSYIVPDWFQIAGG